MWCACKEQEPKLDGQNWFYREKKRENQQGKGKEIEEDEKFQV